jgi:hypothetical protein
MFSQFVSYVGGICNYYETIGVSVFSEIFILNRGDLGGTGGALVLLI